MIYVLKTQSHGEIDSGFCSFFTGFIRIGELSTPTRHFCELNQVLAGNKDVKEVKLLTYDLETYGERWSEALDDILSNFYTAEYNIPEIEQYNRGKQSEAQGEVSVEDETDIFDKGKIITVKLSDRLISIDDYRLTHKEFSYFSYYVAGGGFIGWIDEKYPEFALATLRSMRGSGNKLYRTLQGKKGLFTALDKQ